MYGSNRMKRRPSPYEMEITDGESISPQCSLLAGGVLSAEGGKLLKNLNRKMGIRAAPPVQQNQDLPPTCARQHARWIRFHAAKSLIYGSYIPVLHIA